MFADRLYLILLSSWALVPLYAQSQPNGVLVDPRDGQAYPTVKINGARWMLENLQLKTALSFGPPDTLKAANPTFKGRWYHMDELDSLCPPGWRLPHLEDWIGYFDYLARRAEGSYELKTLDTDYRLTEFDQFFDLFEDGNPLNIVPAGIYEGNEFLYAPGSADYWIMDLERRKDAGKKDYKVVRKSHPGTAHIHLYNAFTHIHSHRHHLDPKKPNELRRFMCRCIQRN